MYIAGGVAKRPALSVAIIHAYVLRRRDRIRYASYSFFEEITGELDIGSAARLTSVIPWVATVAKLLWEHRLSFVLVN